MTCPNNTQARLNEDDKKKEKTYLLFYGGKFLDSHLNLHFLVKTNLWKNREKANINFQAGQLDELFTGMRINFNTWDHRYADVSPFFDIAKNPSKSRVKLQKRNSSDIALVPSCTISPKGIVQFWSFNKAVVNVLPHKAEPSCATTTGENFLD